MTTTSRRRSLSQHLFINTIIYNLNKESDRRATFIENDYPNKNISIEDLALAGFYFFKRPDAVKCAFCHVCIQDFQNGDNAIVEHLKFSPNCPLLEKRRPTGNEPIDQNDFRQRMPSVSSYDECGLKPENKNKEYEFPEYRFPQMRLKTFETWPVGLTQKPAELVAAGFFYSGQSDLVICFSCAVYLNQWDSTDNPWVEHKKWLTKKCTYLELNQDTLEQEEKKYEEFKKLEATESQATKSENEQKNNCVKSQEEIDLENVCKICLERKSRIIFLPCRHVAVCGSCVSGIDDRCPICRTKIKEKHNVIYS